MATPHPIDERHWILPLGVTLGTISTIAFGLRLYSRLPQQLGLDDFFLFIGWMTSTANIVLCIDQTERYHFNRHMWDVPPTSIVGGMRGIFLIAFLSSISANAVKISVSLFYRRLVHGVVSKPLKWSLWGYVGFLAVFTTTMTIVQLVNCVPLEAFWRGMDPTYTKKFKCLSGSQGKIMNTVLSTFAIVLDFATVTIPAVLLFTMTRIRFTKQQRTALLVIFGIGYLTVVAGCFRTYYLVSIVDPSPSKPDKTWYFYNTAAAGIAEISIGIICACAPSLHRLFHHFSMHFSTGGSRSNTKASKSKLSHKSASMHSKQPLDSAATDTLGGEQEEADMRYFGKSFYVNQVRNTLEDDKAFAAPYEDTQVRTICEGPTTPAERGWPLA